MTAGRETMVYDEGTILFAGWEFSQAVEWARGLELSKADVKIYKKDGNVYAEALRELQI